MKLDVAHAVALPALPPPTPPPSAGAFPVPPKSYPDADRPGTIVIPAGYHELTITKLDDLLDNIQNESWSGAMSGVVGRVFAPADDSVRLLEMLVPNLQRPGCLRALSSASSTPGCLARGVGATRPRRQPRRSEQRDAKLERHTLYGADASYVVRVQRRRASVRSRARAECVRALDVDASSRSRTRSRRRIRRGISIATAARLVRLVVVDARRGRSARCTDLDREESRISGDAGVQIDRRSRPIRAEAIPGSAQRDAGGSMSEGRR